MRAVLTLVMAAAAAAASAQNKLPRDTAGWTVFKPSSDTRIAYVSNGGSDPAAQTYSQSDPAVGSDPFMPTALIKPYKTVAAAYAAVRDGYPDWILLRRGDTWYESVSLKNGRSNAEPFLVAAYGAGSESPLLKTGMRAGMSRRKKNSSYMALVGLSFYAHTRNPDSPEYVSADGANGFNLHCGKGYTAKGLLIEGCRFRFYKSNVVQGPGTLTDIVIRRNVIIDNYSANSHSQGLYTKNVSLLLEENVFDHNGWYKRQMDGGNDKVGGQATMFNHNTYFCNSHGVTFHGNMFLRASSIGNKWTANDGPASARDITIKNNLYVEGEIGISMGGNVAGPHRFKNIRITDNVMLDIGRDRPTNRTLGWHLRISAWDGGMVTGNYFLHNTSGIVGNVYAINVNDAHGDRNIAITRNTIYGMRTRGALVRLGGRMSAVTFGLNTVQCPGLDVCLLDAASLSGVSFSKNNYFSGRKEGGWFRTGDTHHDLDGWAAQSHESDATAVQVSFPDPSRTVEKYNASLGGRETFAAFIQEARAQSRTNWRPEYTAAAVNDWIRRGFE